MRANLSDLDAELDRAENLLAVLTLTINAYRPAQSLDAGRELLDAGFKPHWPTAPSSEQLQTRPNGKAEYLYLLWRLGRDGYDGPDGKRKLYVGCDPRRQALARSLTQNRRDLDHLTRRLGELHFRITSTNRDIDTLTRRLADTVGRLHDPLV